MLARQENWKVRQPLSISMRVRQVKVSPVKDVGKLSHFPVLFYQDYRYNCDIYADILKSASGNSCAVPATHRPHIYKAKGNWGTNNNSNHGKSCAALAEETS